MYDDRFPRSAILGVSWAIPDLPYLYDQADRSIRVYPSTILRQKKRNPLYPTRKRGEGVDDTKDKNKMARL